MSNATTNDTNLCKVMTDSLHFGRGFVKMVLEKTPDDAYFHQGYAGANHAAWVAGHLATTDEYFYTKLGGGEAVLPAEWGELFGMNSTCHADQSKYPSRKELESAMDERREKLEAWLTSLSDDELARPIEGDLAQFAKTYAQLGPSLAFHDGYHGAQISACRRSMGMAPLF